MLCTIWLAMPPATSKKQEDSLVLISGNVTFAALMEVNEAVDDTCSDYDVQSLQEVMAVSWLVNSLNEMNYIPGIKIGNFLFVYLSVVGIIVALSSLLLLLLLSFSSSSSSFFFCCCCIYCCLVLLASLLNSVFLVFDIAILYFFF